MTNNIQMTPDKYENRIVLFLDILDFKNIIEKRTLQKHNDKIVDNPQGITQLYNCLKIIREHLNIGAQLDNSKRITQFSDSIVISFYVKENGEIFNLISDIHFLVKRFIKHKILCRGGIAYGKLIHDDKFVFGPGLIAAYIAESKAAMYPRIIMDNTILKFASKYPDNEFNSGDWEVGAIETMVSKDTDDMYYIDYFEKAKSDNFPSDTTEEAYYQELKEIIELNLKNPLPDIKVKYGWMRNKFNRMVQEFKKEKYFEIMGIGDTVLKEKIELYQRMTEIA
jgi:hypothetical protein